jgi:hypothetical protein
MRGRAVALARRATGGAGVSPLRASNPDANSNPTNCLIRPALPAVLRERPVPVTGDRRLLIPSRLRANEACLPNWPALRSLHCAALRFVPYTPARSSPRSPATPVAGPLNTCSPAAAWMGAGWRGCVTADASSQRLDRRAIRPEGLGVTSAAEPPLLGDVRPAALQPLRQAKLAHRPRRCAGRGEGAAHAPVVPPRSPHSAPVTQ